MYCLLLFHQQAEDYQINMSRIGFAGDSAGAVGACQCCGCVGMVIDCGKIAGVLLWYGHGLRDSVTVVCWAVSGMA